MKLDSSNTVREARLTMKYLLRPHGLWQRIAAVWALGLLVIFIILALRLPEILQVCLPQIL